MNDIRFSSGDIAYVIRHHIKDHKNVGYYADKVRVCYYNSGWMNRGGKYYIDHDFDNDSTLGTARAKRAYSPQRLYATEEEANNMVELKNKELELRNEYKNKLKALKSNH